MPDLVPMASTVTESLTTRFPQELIDHIIDAVQHNRSTLLSCALVCRSFLPASQAHIFSSIEFVPPEESTRHFMPAQLHYVLSQSPHLCRYVRHLRIVENRDDWASPWVYLDSALASLLQILPDLRSFYLSHTAFTWASFPAGLKIAICELCQRSKLVRLTLIGLQALELYQFFQFVSSPNLRHLYLEDIILPAPTIDDEIPGTAFCLETLRFYIGAPQTQEIIIRWLTSGEALSEVEILDFLWNSAEPTFAQKLLDACSMRMLHFNLVLTDPWVESVELDLRNLRVLSGLGMGLVMPTIDTVLISWITRSLSSIRPSTPLMFITLTMPGVGDPESNAWEALDTLLSGDLFPALHSLRLDVAPMGEVAEGIIGFVDTTKAGLSRLANGGKLIVTILDNLLE